jgi:hypothetical protein
LRVCVARSPAALAPDAIRTRTRAPLRVARPRTWRPLTHVTSPPPTVMKRQAVAPQRSSRAIRWPKSRWVAPR